MLHSEFRHIKWRPAYVGAKQDWQDRIKNIRIGRKEVEDMDEVRDTAMAVSFCDENLYIVNNKYDIQARKTKSLNDFTASTGGASPVHERASLRLSAVKALVLHEKEDKLNSSDDEKVQYLINSLFDPEFMTQNP